MGLVSSRSPVSKADRLRRGVPIHDVFEIKASYGLGHAAGVVAVLEAFPHRNPRRFVGKTARIVPLVGEALRATIAEARDHHGTISFFFEGLSKPAVPIGATVFLEG